MPKGIPREYRNIGKYLEAGSAKRDIVGIQEYREISGGWSAKMDTMRI